MSQSYKLKIDYTELHKTVITKHAQGDDLGSNDGKTWGIATNNNDAYAIIIHVNFNGTLCKPYIKHDTYLQRFTADQ